MSVATLAAPPVRAGIIDVENDDLRPVSEIAQERLHKRVPPAVIWRWRTKGVHGAKLECVQCCGVWCTTRAAFGQFIREQTANATARGRITQDAPEPTERPASTANKLRKAGLI